MRTEPGVVTTTSVLAVDDSVIYRKILTRVLEGLPGIKVLGTAASGRIALRKIRESVPDVVLLDVAMPEMNGLEVLDILRRDFPEIGVIMVSGVSGAHADTTVQALERGAFDFVPKPETKKSEDGMAILQANLLAVLRNYVIHRMARPRLQQKSGSSSPSASPASLADAPPTVTRGLSPVSRTSRPPRHIDAVVVCVSTGGPSALGRLLPALPGNFPVPVLVVQHMPAPFTRSLAESLDKKSPLRVVEAAEGQEILAGRVFVAPGGRHMLVRKAPSPDRLPRIGLNSLPPRNSCRPSADLLFQSAAEAYGGNVLSLVMTGMGSDGIAGVKALKARGAYCLAQDKASSLIYGMPRAVVEAGLADEVLPLNVLADRTRQLVARARVTGVEQRPTPPVALSETEFSLFCDLIRRVCGINIGDDRHYLVATRLAALLSKYGFRSYYDLYSKAKQVTDGLLIGQIVDAITIKETFWFRDNMHFAILAEVILPRLCEHIESRRRLRPIRVWSAACSTGQEPYSIAMTILEWLRQSGTGVTTPRHFEILATDISPTALRVAEEGRYDSLSMSRGVDDDHRAGYFEQDGRTWTVSEDVRRMVRFRRLNLMDSFGGLGLFDVVFLKNVLTYFAEECKERVLRSVRDVLRDDSCLLLGPVESTCCLDSVYDRHAHGKGAYFTLRRAGEDR